VNGGITGIVLAGGRSQRFGTDKLAASIDGVPVLERAVGALAGIATEVLVAGPAGPANRGPEIAGVSIRLVDDPEPFGGPLQALAGALASASSEIAVVVAGDMPTLVPSVLALLVETLEASAADAVVLADPDDPARRQPVPLAIRVGPARAAAALALEAGDRSLVRLLGRLIVLELPSERWLAIDPEARSLVDIDLPEDLPRARDVARDQRTAQRKR